MNMAIVAFDTLHYANKLKAAGMDSQVAEAQAEVQVQVMSEFTHHHLATKDDVKTLKDEMKALDVKRDRTKNELFFKLGGLMVACTAVLGGFITILSHLK